MQIVLYSIVEAVKIMVCFLALLTLVQIYYKGI